jgi:hypothetical protein
MALRKPHFVHFMFQFLTGLGCESHDVKQSGQSSDVSFAQVGEPTIRLRARAVISMISEITIYQFEKAQPKRLRIEYICRLCPCPNTRMTAPKGSGQEIPVCGDLSHQ